MSVWLQHLPVLPVLIPLIAAALMLLTRDNQRRLRVTLGAIALGLMVLVALMLVRATQGIGVPSGPTAWVSTCWATGRRPSASCWWPTAWRH